LLFPIIISHCDKGNYDEALKLLESYKGNTHQILLKLNHAYIVGEMGRFEESIGLYDELSQYRGDFNKYTPIIDLIVLLNKASMQNLSGNLSLAFNEIQAAEEILLKLVLKPDIIKQEVKELIDFIPDEFPPAIQVNFLTQLQLNFNIIKSRILHRFGNLKESSKLLENNISVIDFKREFAFSCAYLMPIYRDLGKNMIAMDLYRSAYEIAYQLEMKSLIGYLYFQKGIIYLYDQGLEIALDNLKKSLEIRQQLPNVQDLAAIHDVMGFAYMQKGQIEHAKDHIEESLRLRIIVGNNSDISSSHASFGMLLIQLGAYEEALIHLNKAINMHQSTIKLTNYSLTYVSAIYCYSELKQVTKAKDYYEKLKQIYGVENEEYFNLYLKLCESFILRSDGRLRSKVRALDLYDEILRTNIMQSVMFWKIILLNKCQILIEDLKDSNNHEILVELNDTIDIGFTFAKSKNVHSFYIELLIMKSRLLLMENKIDKAESYLQDALILVKNRELSFLSSRIEEEISLIENKRDILEDMITKNTELISRMEETEIEEMLYQFLYKRKQHLLTMQDKPKLILILNPIGLCIYSRNFVKDSIDNQLIAAFITAINSISMELLHVEGSIERIRHNDYTISIKVKNKITYCYVFSGPSYGAMLKLDKMIQSISINQDLVDLFRSNVLVINEEIQEAINEIVDSIFGLEHQVL